MEFITDDTSANSDWIKIVWNYPPYKSKAFLKEIENLGITIEQFRQMPIYQFGKEQGLIVEDEWTGNKPIPWGKWGLIHGVPLKEQVKKRTDFLVSRIQNEINQGQEDKGRYLYNTEVGALILEKMDGISEDSPTEGLSFGSGDTNGMKGLQRADQKKSYTRGLKNINLQVQKYLSKKPLPEILYKATVRAFYSKERHIIVARSLEDPMLLQAVQHFLDSELEKTGEATVIARNNIATEGELIQLSSFDFALPGPWLDAHDGKVLGRDTAWLQEQSKKRRIFTPEDIQLEFGSDSITNLTSQSANRFQKGEEVPLCSNWQKSPEQVAFYIASLSGAFITWEVD